MFSLWFELIPNLKAFFKQNNSNSNMERIMMMMMMIEEFSFVFVSYEVQLSFNNSGPAFWITYGPFQVTFYHTITCCPPSSPNEKCNWLPLIVHVSALDPAGPKYTRASPEERLDPGDALFVEAIHTDSDSKLMTCFPIIFQFYFFLKTITFQVFLFLKLFLDPSWKSLLTINFHFLRCGDNCK